MRRERSEGMCDRSARCRCSRELVSKKVIDVVAVNVMLHGTVCLHVELFHLAAEQMI